MRRKRIEKQLEVLRVIKIIAGIISVLGFIYILGTAGASDCNKISFEQVITQSLIGTAMFAGGFGVMWLVEKHQEAAIERLRYLQEQRENYLEHRRRKKARERSFEEYVRRTELERKREELFKEANKIHEDLRREATTKK